MGQTDTVLYNQFVTFVVILCTQSWKGIERKVAGLPSKTLAWRRLNVLLQGLAARNV